MSPREFLIRKFFEDIKDFTYVVQRNWENLPQDYAVAGHDDLDLFATDDDAHRIRSVLQNYPEILCDVRSPQDDYYPKDIAQMLLTSRMEQDGFYIPGPIPGFLAIYYHNLVHKNDDPYKGKLNDMFKEMFPPVRCKDAGVGFYGID